MILITFGDNDFRHNFDLAGAMIVAVLEHTDHLYEDMVENPTIIEDIVKVALKLRGQEKYFNYLMEESSAWSGFIGSNPAIRFGNEAADYVMKRNFDFNSEALWIDMNDPQPYRII